MPVTVNFRHTDHSPEHSTAGLPCFISKLIKCKTYHDFIYINVTYPQKAPAMITMELEPFFTIDQTCPAPLKTRKHAASNRRFNYDNFDHNFAVETKLLAALHDPFIDAHDTVSVYWSSGAKRHNHALVKVGV